MCPLSEFPVVKTHCKRLFATLALVAAAGAFIVSPVVTPAAQAKSTHSSTHKASTHKSAAKPKPTTAPS
jgi:hypothetical protein